MESVVFKYSDFFDDDGGFDKIRKDFDTLGEDLIKKAKSIREQTKLIDTEQNEAVAEMETQVEGLAEVFEKYGKTKKDLKKIEKEFLKQKAKEGQATEEQLKNLTKLDKRLQEYRTNLKELNKTGTIHGKVVSDVNEERVKTQINIKKVTKEIRDQEKEILKANELSREEQKLLKAKITLQNDEVRTLDEVRARMSALRTVVQSLDLQDQAEQIKKYNDEINDLSDVLSGNSDKFIQSKINIGNYEESITNALKSSSLFKTNISGLDAVLENVLGTFLLTRAEIEAMEKAGDANTNMIKRMTIAFGKLNKALKASVIGVVLVAVSALAGAFGDTRAGAIRLEKVMATIQSTFTTFGQVSGILVEELMNTFKSITNFIKNPFAKATVDTSKKTESAWKRIIDAIKNGADAVVVGLENIDKAFKLEDNIRRLNQEIEILNGKLAVAQLRAGDATRSLTTQLIENKKALSLTEEIAEKQLSVARQQLEMVNERVKQNIKANAVEASNIDLSLKGEAFARATLDLAEKRGSQLAISNDLIEQQQQAVLDVIQVENDLRVTREENAKERREIERDLFEQNLDLLIDLIDTEKNLSEQYVNDTTKNFKKRINEFNRFIVKFRSNAQRELNEFNKLAQKSATLAREQLSKVDPSSSFGKEQIEALQAEINKLENVDFQISFDDNGDFKVFNNGVELTLKDIVELNKQLQQLGIAEIPINRFREFNIETTNAVRDFRDLNKELNNMAISIKEMSKNVIVSQDEINALDAIQEKINQLTITQRSATTEEEREKIAKQLVELEKQKTAIAEFANEQRLLNRRDAIDDELKLVEHESQRYFELLQERLDIEKQIREKSIDDNLKSQKEANDKQIDSLKTLAGKTKDIMNQIADQAIESNRKRVDSAEDRVNKQTDLIEEQRRRAEAGLTNTLAFEQRELGKREAELIKQQKRQERLEKIRALYSSYSNYSSRGDENPIAKALKDFAILEAISATFKEGGITGIDGVKTNRHGITVGKRHDRNGSGGNLAWHESGEGFFSRKEVSNMGHQTFYKIKDMAGKGQIDSNFFSGQRKEFVENTNMITFDPGLRDEIREVKKAIEGKPVSNWRVSDITKKTIDVVEEVVEGKTVKRNHHIIKKPRL